MVAAQLDRLVNRVEVVDVMAPQAGADRRQLDLLRRRTADDRIVTRQVPAHPHRIVRLEAEPGVERPDAGVVPLGLEEHSAGPCGRCGCQHLVQGGGADAGSPAAHVQLVDEGFPATRLE